MARTFIFKATGMEYAGTVTKATAERYAIGIDLRSQMRSGATLQNASAIVTDLTEAEASTSALLPSARATILEDRIAQIIIQAGTSGHRYKVLFTLVDSSKFIYQEAILLIVRS